MKSYKSRGIVLHTVKYGERSLVVYMLTEAHGRQSYMAYGRSPLLGPMFLVEFEGWSSTKAELHRYKELSAAVPLMSIPFDARKSTIALFMAEVVYRLVREQEPNRALFEFVWRAVERLDALGTEDEVQGVANYHLWFLVGLSRHLGFAPAGEWMPGGWFDIREGVFTPIRPTHGDCFSTEDTELLWRLLQDGTDEMGETGGLGLNRVRRGVFLSSMLDFLSYHLDAVKQIRSVEILREVF